jgi:hypothetical protein
MKFAIQRIAVVNPHGASQPYFDTRSQAQHVADEMRLADPGASFIVVEAPDAVDPDAKPTKPVAE